MDYWVGCTEVPLVKFHHLAALLVAYCLDEDATAEVGSDRTPCMQYQWRIQDFERGKAHLSDCPLPPCSGRLFTEPEIELVDHGAIHC